MRIRALGDRALFVDLPDLAAVLTLHEALQAPGPAGVEDLVPAARTLAVLLDPARLSLDAARTWLVRTAGEITPDSDRTIGGASAEDGGAGVADVDDYAGRQASSCDELVLDVVYDGDDLVDLATLLGVSVDDLVRRHTGAAWRVAFGGFAPGFGYLVTDDDWFEVPRRDSPRTRVPAGSVALAGAFSGAYPREGPGGWQLIGRTDAPLWRPRDPRPALLAPGTLVRFRAVDAFASPSAPSAAGSGTALTSDDEAHGARDLAATGRESSAVVVVDAGMQLLVEDLGRRGFASVGAGRSGALDRAALRLGNRLIGNREGAAGLEVVVGARLRFEQPTWFAVTGARGALRLGGHPIEPDAAVHAAAGDELQLGPAEHGLRFSVALRGGIAVPRELGSAASDIGAGVGPAQLAAGDVLTLGDAVAGAIPAVDALTVAAPPDEEVDVHVVAGPRADWFTLAAVAAFYDVEWEVTQASNRVGMRLRSPDGITLERSPDPRLPAELPSEAMVPGCVQVPPSGEPTVLLADGPVTGGYPVIAVVTDADLDLFGQLRPGQRVRFRHARAAG
ncbi:5-oxoprolinase/urea amidolyase family protein [Planctomonas sp. JC2975]|nr:5-oxoprolinase/urea amidolyase family protein [Planctomonas sp. JC2975]NNC11937.1 5-oxoprolinase/urea amidolyase family protein [Planctomonas sp. JC2975]